MPDVQELSATWIANGTTAAEPVTVETPAEQPRGPDGKFIATEGAPLAAPTDTPAPAPVATEPVAVPPADATPQQIADYIAGKVGDAEFQIPKGLLVPQKHRGEITYRPIEEILKDGQREIDYQHKMELVGRQRRDAETRLTAVKAEEARVAARAQWVAEQDAEMREAQKDPDKWAAYQQSLEMYQSNPRYRQMVDDALAKRETDAELAVHRDREMETATQQGAEMAYGWITGMATEFPGVDPERVRLLYVDALKLERADISPEAVRAIYQAEAGYVQQASGPLMTQLATLKAQVEALTAAKAAEQHNATTQHALTRGKTPPLAVSGAPPAPAPPVRERFSLDRLAEKNAEWAKRG